jgi:DNA polymerase III subunit delta
MTAIKAGDVDRTLQKIDDRITVLLFYGPDNGLVSERAQKTAFASVKDPHDAFQLIKIDNDDVAADPQRLIDEVNTYGLFGDKRVIWVKSGSKNIANAVEIVLQNAAPQTQVIIEAGDLNKTSPLRRLCEASLQALALPCYTDSIESLGLMIEDSVKRAKLAIDPVAKQNLILHLGADRQNSRQEIEKLITYCLKQERIQLEDVEAIISDASLHAVDALIDAAFTGQLKTINDQIIVIKSDPQQTAMILVFLLRHSLSLLSARAHMEHTKTSAPQAAEQWRGLHFKRKDMIIKQIGLWPSALLLKIIQRLQETIYQSRLSHNLELTLMSRLVFDIARTAQSLRK